MGYIYKITNQINNKIYIGKTIYTIEHRWKTHIKDSKKEECKNRPLYKAINKYGIENFSIEEVEYCDNEVLNEREIYWISYYNSYHNGYNATLGGDGSSCVDYKFIYELWKQGYTYKYITDKYGHDNKTIQAALNNYGISNKKIKERQHDIQLEKQARCVNMLDKETREIIKTFNTISEAALYITGDREKIHHIIHVCQGKRKSAYGYAWEYIDENIILNNKEAK